MPPKNINALTCLRGYAALWVALFHLRNDILKAYPGLPPVLLQPLQLGNLWVDLFFLLSGFVIALNYSQKLGGFNKHSYLEFLLKRLARIYPAYLVALVFMVMSWLMLSNSQLTWADGRFQYSI